MNPTHHQTLGQLLTERVTLDIVFDKVGVDFAAGPFKKSNMDPCESQLSSKDICDPL